MKNPLIPSLAGWCNQAFRLLGLALLAILATGCAGTFHEVRALSPTKRPVERPTTLVLYPVEIADGRLSPTEKEVYQLKFRQGVEAWLQKTNAFANVLGGTNAPAGGVILVGKIQEVEKGSAAARFWVGMGAGQARVQGEFEIQDPMGGSLARFAVRRSYLGGSGIGGYDMLSMDELTFRLGQTVAETVFQWLQGKKLE